MPLRPEHYDLSGHVAFFEAVRLALGLGPLTLVGHSWRGLVAMAYAALEPNAVRRLIVIDGYAGGGSIDTPTPNDSVPTIESAIVPGLAGRFGPSKHRSP